MTTNDDSDSCFGPCHICGLNEETSYYFRPLDAHTCHECRKANRHLMTIGDAWVELRVRWEDVQPYWLYRMQLFIYQLFKLGPVKMYRHRKVMEKFYNNIYR